MKFTCVKLLLCLEQYGKMEKVLRKELGKIIFSNEENKLKLEAYSSINKRRLSKNQKYLKNRINHIL